MYKVSLHDTKLIKCCCGYIIFLKCKLMISINVPAIAGHQMMHLAYSYTL